MNDIRNIFPDEEILEPSLPIVDSHHHLWLLKEFFGGLSEADGVLTACAMNVFETHGRYLFDELLSDLYAGHNIVATVFMEAGSMYRDHGPEAERPIGEVEFARGMAAMGDSGQFGPSKPCMAIVGKADLRLGALTAPLLGSLVEAGGGRLKGIRLGSAFDPDPALNTHIEPGILADPRFHDGFRLLAPLGLSFDAWLFHPQIPELVELARAFPETRIILNHLGCPLMVARYANRETSFADWKMQLRQLQNCDNVYIKLGGLGMGLQGLASFGARPRFTSGEIAREWKPFIETAIDIFGAARCMFESNYPTDAGSCSYTACWNAFKRICSDYSPDEKRLLFFETANRAYRLGL